MRIVNTILRMKPAIGGGEEVVWETSQELARRGHDIRVVCSNLLTPDSHSRRVEGITKQPGLVVRRLGAFHPIATYPVVPLLPLELARSRMDLIHAHGYGYSTSDMAAIVSEATGRPLVLSLHGFFPVTTKVNTHMAHFYVAFSRINLLRRASRIICQSNQDAFLIRQLARPDKVVVIHNGIDPERWKVLPQKDLFRRKNRIDTPIILAVGRIVEGKGFQNLLQALPMVLRKCGDVRVVVVGRDFGYLESLKALASKIGVSEKVVFTGELTDDELLEAYVDATVFTMPSLYEPFGLVVLEAMAAGLPVVGTRYGGVSDIVEESVNGFLIDPRDPIAYSAALSRVIMEDGFRRAVHDTNRKKVMEKFTYHTMVDQLEELYREVLGA